MTTHISPSVENITAKHLSRQYAVLCETLKPTQFIKYVAVCVEILLPFGSFFLTWMRYKNYKSMWGCEVCTFEIYPVATMVPP